MTETEARFRSYQTLMKSVQDGIHVMDMEGNIVEVNDAFCDMLGYTQEEACQLNIADWNAQWSKQELLARLKNHIGKSARFDTVHRRKDGTLINVEICTTGVEIEGQPYFFASSRDITERKKSEALIKHHTLVINSVHEGFWGGDIKGNLLEVNPAYADMSGYSVDELLKLNIRQLDATDDDQLVQARIKKVLEQGHDLFETRHRHKDGHLFDVEASVSYIEELQRFFAFFRDITGRKLIESKLRLSEQKFGGAFHDSPDAIVISEINTGLVSEINQSFTNLFGYSEEDVIGRSTIEFGLWFDKASRNEAISIIESKGYLHNHEVKHRTKDGRVLTLLASSTQLHFNGTTSLVVHFRDITDRKQIESDLRIAAIAFESHESVMITDANGVILRVNRAFTDSTGYTPEEALGQTPRLFKSGRHDANFYRTMWETILRTGKWEGEIWDRRKNGEVYPKWLTITAVKGDDGVVTHYVGAHFDITERKAAEEKIKHLAYYDALTGLPNRRLLMDRLQQALASSARSARQGALLIIDLDNFKALNDTLGHDVGDMLLQQVAQRLQPCVREGDTVARLGGDEFVLVLENLSEQTLEAAAQTEAIGEKILTALNRPYQLGAHDYRTTSSIGVTLFIGHQSSLEELMKQTDIAMYQAKKAGRNTLRFFDPQMQETINERVSLESELHKALEQQQFQLYYQIQVDISRRPLGAEALIRWSQPERGMVSPAQFIPLAEETGLILPIGQWVLETACAQIKAWEQDALTRDLVLAVNVSPKEFRQAGFVAQVQASIQRHGINPKLLKLELTESLLLENVENTILTMNVLNEIGVQFSLDDFGTGYSSLQYLKQLPLDQLKIDRSFVRDIATDSSDIAIVRTIVAMAQSLNLDVIAEGVETEEQRQLLLENGCSRHQGYLFSKPVPIEQFEALLKAGLNGRFLES
jgi:diguanylate cyclase (GGDEF)-like protein/PAS domain S-box-containing protein